MADTSRITPEQWAALSRRTVYFGHQSVGVNVLEVIVENIDGIRSKSQRTIHAGETALSNAAKLDRNDYALLILTDKYDNWTPLVNPVFDGRSIATHLQKSYGFRIVDGNQSVDGIHEELRHDIEEVMQGH